MGTKNRGAEEMKFIVKAALLFSLFCFMQMHVSEQLQAKGRQLAFLRNLPHRYLGMLYYSWLLQQHRTDYLIQYASEWNVAVRHRESLLEGMTKPTVVLLVVKASSMHPNDENLRLMSKFLVSQELKERE
jgi:hypothetical protein